MLILKGRTMGNIPIEAKIRIIALAVEFGISDKDILKSLKSDGYSTVRSSTILRWAKRIGYR